MPSLKPLPESFERTRVALHRVAEQIVAPARKPDNEIALQATPGGYGTPEFEWEGATHQVRVEGTELVHTIGSDERRAPLSSLAEATGPVSELVPDPPRETEPLEVDPASAQALAEWYALGNEALEGLRGEAPPVDAATAPTLWPEHFDIAIESGAEAKGIRANYGFSPGDEDHPEPYLYVGPWTGELEGELWNATSFNGAELAYAELLAADDPLTAALDFCRRRRTALDPTKEENS
jgi:hypothetical protein